MGMVKKFVLLFAVLVLVGGGLWYYRYSKDTYDPSKYSATITSAPANSEGLTEAPAPVLGDGGSTKTAKPAFVGLAKGSKIELTLPDQFEKPHTVSPDVKTLILALSKEAGATARGYLDRQDSEFLSQHNAVFIVDISPIPVVIRNSMVLPELKKRTYPFLLVYEEEMATALKSKEDSTEVAIVRLLNNVVQGIEYAGNDAEMEAAIP